MSDTKVRGQIIFGTAFNVENRNARCRVSVVVDGDATQSEPLVLSDALRFAEFAMGEYAEDWVELSACMANVRRSGYGSVDGVNVRVIPLKAV